MVRAHPAADDRRHVTFHRPGRRIAAHVLRGIAGTAFGVALVTMGARDDSTWSVVTVILGICCLVIGIVSLAQAAMVWSGRPRLVAVAALVEAAHLVLWLVVISPEGSGRLHSST